MQELVGLLNSEKMKIAIVISRFNDFINNKLLEGAIDCYNRHGGDTSQVALVRVPGAFEIPLATQRMAKSGKFDGILALGTIIRGATPHFDFIAKSI